MTELFDATQSPSTAYPMSTGLILAMERLGRWGFSFEPVPLREAVGELMHDMELAKDPSPPILEYFTEVLALSITVHQANKAEPLLQEWGSTELREFLEKLRNAIFDHFAR